MGNPFTEDSVDLLVLDTGDVADPAIVETVPGFSENKPWAYSRKIAPLGHIWAYSRRVGSYYRKYMFIAYLSIMSRFFYC